MIRKVVIIEDEGDLSRLLAHTLRREGYEPAVASDGVSGLQTVRRERPDLVVLDLMLPEMDGLEVCRRLKADARTGAIPIIMLTAKAEESDKIVGLELGADDYVTKPFSTKELLARIKAVLRRSAPEVEQGDVFQYGPLRLDESRHEVSVKGREVKLTAKEFGLLSHLLQNQGRVLSRDFLLNRVWGYDAEVASRTVDVHIRRLRENIPLLSKAVETVKSYGYKLREGGA